MKEYHLVMPLLNSLPNIFHSISLVSPYSYVFEKLFEHLSNISLTTLISTSAWISKSHAELLN